MAYNGKRKRSGTSLSQISGNRIQRIQLLQSENQDLKSENKLLKARILELEKSRPSNFQCSVCLRFYKRADALRIHIENSRDDDHISLAKNLYGIESCCSQDFRRRCDLDRHRNGGKCKMKTQKELTMTDHSPRQSKCMFIVTRPLLTYLK